MSAGGKRGRGPSVETVEGPDGEPILVLVVDGAYQSATYLGKRRYEPVFSYYRAFDCLFEARPAARDVLVLGGGGCAWPKHVVSTRPDVRLDVVEIDPAVVRLAWDKFFVRELVDEFGAADRLRLVTADARAYLDGCGKTYDAIVNDCFSGRAPVRSLMTLEAARSVARRLAPAGVYLANVVTEHEGTDASTLSSAVAALAQVFAHVQVIPCADEGFSGEDNYHAVASNGPLDLAGAVPFGPEFHGPVLRD